MANLFDPSAVKACYAQFQTADANRDALFNQLLDGYETLYKENAKIREMLEEERETRLMWQDMARNSKKELSQTRLVTVRCPVACLCTLICPSTPTDRLAILPPY